MILDLIKNAASAAASVMAGLIAIMLFVKIIEAWRDFRAFRRPQYQPLRYRLRMLFTTKATRKAMAALQPAEDGMMDMEQRVALNQGRYLVSVTNIGSSYSTPPVIIITK